MIVHRCTVLCSTKLQMVITIRLTCGCQQWPKLVVAVGDATSCCVFALAHKACVQVRRVLGG